MKETFPIIYTALQILGTIPVTTCECERSNSALKPLKDYKRSTIGQERLNGLALLSVYQSIPRDYERILDIFATKHPRQMRLKNFCNKENQEEEEEGV